MVNFPIRKAIENIKKWKLEKERKKEARWLQQGKKGEIHE
jgi:hypothetical protein